MVVSQVHGVMVALLLGRPEVAMPPSPAVARPEWKRQLEYGLPRVDVGVQGGRHVGGFLRGEWHPLAWRRGELALGGIFATHVYFQRDPRRPQEGVPLRGLDTSVNLAPTLGHTFRLARRRVSLSTFGYTGISIRSQRTSVTDEAHDFTKRHDTVRAYADFGIGVSLGVRLGRSWGLGLHGVVPLWVGPPSYGLPLSWTVTSPWAGLHVSYYFRGRG